MKRLVLVRHAKSSWDGDISNDHDRPLNERGKRDAPVMGERLAARGVEPDRIITSSAKRARKTARKIAKELDYRKKDVVRDGRLYGCSVEDWMALIHDLDDRWDCVVMVGHNPTITEMAHAVAGLPVDNVPTCGVLDMRFDITTWAEVGAEEPEETDFDYPKHPEANLA